MKYLLILIVIFVGCKSHPTTEKHNIVDTSSWTIVSDPTQEFSDSAVLIKSRNSKGVGFGLKSAPSVIPIAPGDTTTTHAYEPIGDGSHQELITSPTSLRLRINNGGLDTLGSKVKLDSQFIFPRPIRDTTWYEQRCDTTWGTIEVDAGQGKIIGPGFVMCCLDIHWTKSIFSDKDKAMIDSSWFSPYPSAPVGISYGPCKSSAFIKTKEGYKEVNQSFILKP